MRGVVFWIAVIAIFCHWRAQHQDRGQRILLLRRLRDPAGDDHGGRLEHPRRLHRLRELRQRRLLRDRRLHLGRSEQGARAADRRAAAGRGAARRPGRAWHRLPDAAPARRLFRHRHARDGDRVRDLRQQLGIRWRRDRRLHPDAGERALLRRLHRVPVRAHAVPGAARDRARALPADLAHRPGAGCDPRRRARGRVRGRADPAPQAGLDHRHGRA